jgi:hypothetical protein
VDVWQALFLIEATKILKTWEKCTQHNFILDEFKETEIGRPNSTY